MGIIKAMFFVYSNHASWWSSLKCLPVCVVYYQSSSNEGIPGQTTSIYSLSYRIWNYIVNKFSCVHTRAEQKKNIELGLFWLVLRFQFDFMNDNFYNSIVSWSISMIFWHFLYKQHEILTFAWNVHQDIFAIKCLHENGAWNGSLTKKRHCMAWLKELICMEKSPNNTEPWVEIELLIYKPPKLRKVILSQFT